MEVDDEGCGDEAKEVEADDGGWPAVGIMVVQALRRKRTPQDE